MLTCREFVDFMMQYLDGELARDSHTAFETHLDACPGCEVYLDQYKATVALGRSICDDPDGPVPDDVPERLVQAILAARSQGD